MLVAYALSERRHAAMRDSIELLAAVVLISVWLNCASASDSSSAPSAPAPRGTSGRSTAATIHWRDVPLSDALARLEKLFGDSIFLDRRIDPSGRVNLDIRAASVEEVLTPISVAQQLGISRSGRVVYVGPSTTARQLKAVARARLEEVARLPESRRAMLRRKRNLSWPRLTEPRGLVASLVELDGWRLEGAERIPHDLWPAGDLPALTPVEQLTILLAGFDLTFAPRADEKVIELVPLEKSSSIRVDDLSEDDVEPATRDETDAAGTKQVYTLRVVEKPVGPVLRELGRRLNWQIEFDEPAIRAAGRSLDERVSIAVENVEQDKLLQALLQPAGLTFEREGKRIRIVPDGAAR